MAIHTSLSETGPLVLLEYMANGLPFVTSNTGEVVDQIRDELPDLIVSTFNEEDWIEKIIALENEIQINGQFINRKLKELFNKKFSPEKYIEQCLKIYQNVLTS
jgi:glycosyltransferase involved in cell wall biosynthesis